MSNPILPAALVGLFSGGVAAAAVVIGLQKEPTPPLLAETQDNSEVLARLDQVLHQNKQLTERLDRLENESRMVAPAAIRTSGNDLEQGEIDQPSRSPPAPDRTIAVSSKAPCPITKEKKVSSKPMWVTCAESAPRLRPLKTRMSALPTPKRRPGKREEACGKACSIVAIASLESGTSE